MDDDKLVKAVGCCLAGAIWAIVTFGPGLVALVAALIWIAIYRGA